MNPQWKWHGYAVHYILGHKCRWHLATELPNGYMVSSVGDLILSDSDKKPREIGDGYLYDTMVFKVCGHYPCGCPTADSNNCDFRSYNKHEDARAGHLELCEKWAAVPPNQIKEQQDD